MPNWSTNAGAQAVTTLISEKPAAIIVHNPDVQTYAKLMQRAENEGIYIIQINMGSVYRSSAFVGANWIEIGERDAEAVVKACQGKSNKIAIVQGALSAAASAYTLKGVENVLAKHPEIKVVSSQAADWDAAKAKAITQTVLKQNPDLCGIVGFWDGMDIGTAAAVKEAGLTGKVFVATSGGGERKGACELVKSGAFDLNLSYDVPTQAADTPLAACVSGYSPFSSSLFTSPGSASSDCLISSSLRKAIAWLSLKVVVSGGMGKPQSAGLLAPSRTPSSAAPGR